MAADAVTLAVPCRTDEPALGRTLDAALAGWRALPDAGRRRLEILVCLNGPDAAGPAAALRAAAAAAGAPLLEVDADAGPESPATPATAIALVALRTRRVGKAVAWNLLRRAARGPLVLFLDADVSFAPDAPGLLLAALAAHPAATLASGKTVCAPRRGPFERIMAVPYRVDFPNLSPQLYAARLAALPPAMPEDLFDPERWLELTVGAGAIVRVPAARVAVRLPGTPGDFFRQRVRIELGKVQLAREYPALAPRGAPQPGWRAVLGHVGVAGTPRLAAYGALRAVAHAIAWARYRRGATAGVWRQPASTKRWDAA